MNLLLSTSKISCSRVNAFTFEGWSSVITARTLSPTLAKSSIHLLTSRFNYLPVTFVSGRERITIAIDFFKEKLMKTTIPLNKFPSSSCPTKWPLCYCTDFRKYILSMIKIHSLDTACFSRSNLTIFSESTSPDVIFFKTLNEGSGSSFTRCLYVWHELYRNINANRIKTLENFGRLWSL